MTGRPLDRMVQGTSRPAADLSLLDLDVEALAARVASGDLDSTLGPLRTLEAAHRARPAILAAIDQRARHLAG